MADAWVFVIGVRSEYSGKHIIIKGTRSSTRTQIIKKYGFIWEAQISLEEWTNNRPSEYANSQRIPISVLPTLHD